MKVKKIYYKERKPKIETLGEKILKFDLSEGIVSDFESIFELELENYDKSLPMIILDNVTDTVRNVKIGDIYTRLYLDRR